MNYIEQVLNSIKRSDFLPVESRLMADLDAPISIGYGQTNSQPSTVRMMLVWLDPQPGDKVLDIGSGSGWTTALLSKLVGSRGSVVAVERVPELKTFGETNCKKLKLKNISFHMSGKEFGWKKLAPYDRILVSASAQTVPSTLINQLKPDGRLVIPVLQSILVIDKNADESVLISEHPGFVFVPLLNSWS
jgi:protein-L-isoaspartate(D-aspartate) O-methyltransferase